MRANGTAIRPRTPRAALLLAACASFSALANAQPTRASKATSVETAHASEGPRTGEPKASALKNRFGLDVASRLVRGSEAADVKRGIERARAIGTEDAVAFLASLADGTDATRTSADLELALTRALVRLPNGPAVRKALEAIVTSTANDASNVRDLTRQIAALALARFGDPTSTGLLLALVERDAIGAAAARSALLAYPPSRAFRFDATTATPALVSLAGDFGDLRAAPFIVPLLGSKLAPVRAAAATALGKLRDSHLTQKIEALAADPDPRVRIAIVGALVDLANPKAAALLASLIEAEETATAAVELAQRVDDPKIARALAARAKTSSDEGLRSSVFRALGKQSNAVAVDVLVAFVAVESDAGNALEALARSPAANAPLALDRLLAAPKSSRGALRACFVRRLGSRAPCSTFEDRLRSAATSADEKDRALATFIEVAIGAKPAVVALRDPSALVRRSVAAAYFASTESARDAFVDAYAREKDAPARHALGVALVAGDPQGRLSESSLRTRSDEGGVDATLVSFVRVTRWAAGRDEPANLRGSAHALVRTATYSGLAFSPAPSASGFLANAYEKEFDVRVRRVIVRALVARNAGAALASDEEPAPVVSSTLAMAAETDPDAKVRAIASQNLATPSTALAAQRSIRGAAVDASGEVTWIHVADSKAGKRQSPIELQLLTPDGIVVPVVVDADGYALLPGIRSGVVEVVLAPVFPTYESAKP